MKFFKSTFIFSILAALILFSSCKKCKVDSVSTNGGAIIEDVVIYPRSGYMTPNMNGNYVIGAGSYYSDKFEVSVNGGEITPVNYSNFKIIACPVTARCNASFERIVDINNTSQTVTYTLNVTQCSNCKEERFTENYVMIPTFPDTYNVVYDVNITDKE